MDKLQKTALLKSMLSQIAPGDALETVIEPVRREVEKAGGFESVGGGGFESVRGAGFETLETTPVENVHADAERGLQKLADDRPHEMTDEEIFGLEAIVMPQNRPVVFVRGEAYDDIGEPWLSLNPPAVKSRIARLLPSIGRIEVPNSPLIPYGGTGFVVGKGLLMTNRHVAALFSRGLGLTIRYTAGDAAVDFKRQVDSRDGDTSAYLVVRGVEMVHPFWDMALLAVDGLPEGRVLSLSTRSPDDLADHNIVAVGYPARDDRSDLALQDRIFGGKYNVKRLQPGILRRRANVRSFENRVNALTHDASTLGGNSGSAIIDVDTGEVVALHFAGAYLKANYAVPMYELARDSRVVASKLNFDGALTPSNDFDPSWASILGLEASSTAQPEQQKQLVGQADGPSVDLQSPKPSPRPQGPEASHVATWTIPLKISISVGPAEPTVHPAPAPQSADAADMVEAEEAVVVDPDYSNRAGYDAKFLDGLALPLPRLSEAMKQDTAEVRADARTHDDRFELAYHHYSIYMNKRRRTAWFSAANVDGDQRPNIGKREGDRWFRDPRIDRSEQLGQEAFETGIDRGHLTRREDTAWGSDVASASAANADTFHFTNCSLQASAFNRGKERWQGLEQFLLEKHAKKERRRMTVITGPLFASNDPAYRNEKMTYTVRCPLRFWKVCVLIRQDGTPSATAFLLGQPEISDLPGFEETFDVAATQITVAELETKTGLDFGKLKDHDNFARSRVPGALEGVAAVPTGLIRGEGDIVV